MIDQLYILPILLFSVIIHEISHGWMALRLGDPTARDMGRLTLNPIPHIDLFGSILVPLMSLASTGQVFIAWAKPVPINPGNFKHYTRDDILVSTIGPLSNIVLSLFCTACFIILLKIDHAILYSEGSVRQAMHYLMEMFYGGISLNIILAVFNMIPIPPLDGSHVLASLLPLSLSLKYRRVGFFGIFLLILLMRWEPFARIFHGIILTLISPFMRLISFFV